MFEVIQAHADKAGLWEQLWRWSPLSQVQPPSRPPPPSLTVSWRTRVHSSPPTLFSTTALVFLRRSQRRERVWTGRGGWWSRPGGAIALAADRCSSTRPPSAGDVATFPLAPLSHLWRDPTVCTHPLQFILDNATIK